MEIWLYYSNQKSRTHAFRSRIAFHAARLSALKVSNHYTKPLTSESSDATTTAVIESPPLPCPKIRSHGEPVFYMCGTSAMMQDFAEGLIARGVPHFDIFREPPRSPA